MPRAHPLSFKFGLDNKDIDFECMEGPLNKGKNTEKCVKKELNFPCGGYVPNEKLVTRFEAGQIFNVSFFSQGLNDSIFFNNDQNRFYVDKELFDKNHAKDNQGRHNGGDCEFALSYDGGRSFTKIATYHKSCPDMAYNWTVKIPENAPSCKTGVNDKKLGDCIFSWNWLSNITQEFYQNCADIEIIGNLTAPLKIVDITKANLAGIFDTKINIIGEKPKCAPDFIEDSSPGSGKVAICNAEGNGPLTIDTDTNLRGLL